MQNPQFDPADDQLDLDFDPPALAPARPRLALATDAPVESAARRLQDELARGLRVPAVWSVRRTLVFGAAFHLVVLGALGLAAGGVLSQLAR